MEVFRQDAGFEESLSLEENTLFLPSSEEGREEEFDIIHLFGKEKLENIQKSLSKATGLAFVTVDYRGEPITESTFFTRFCRAARDDSMLSLRCKSSDAFGSIQAAVLQRPSVYFCPCGLLEVAIPIVVRGHYLGGFIGGQIRCSDAPEEISRLEKVMSTAALSGQIEQNKAFLDEIPEYSFEKFSDIVNLVFLVINQLSENEINLQMRWESMQKQVKKLYGLNQKYIKENRQKDLRILELKAAMDPYSIIDTMVSLVNLTVIEDAPRTNEMLQLFIEHVKYSFMEKGTFVNVSRELENVERYLRLQKMKLGEKFEYSIQIPQTMNMQKIPSDIILPFVQNAVYYGAMMKKEGGSVSIRGYINSGRCVLEVEDNGPGLDDEEIKISFEQLKDRHEGYYITMGMDNARVKLKKIFGDGSDIMAENNKGKGRRNIICWPEHFSERID